MLIEPTIKSRLATRLAQPSDIPALQDLIEQSARTLLRQAYTDRQIESMLLHLIGVDRQLIDDSTYYVAEIDGRIVGGGGWTYRQEIAGTRAHFGSKLAEVDDAALIRVMFVHPDFARQSVGSELLHVSEAAARSCGFHRARLIATLTGVPFYARHGWQSQQEVEIYLPEGVSVTGLSMTKTLT